MITSVLVGLVALLHLYFMLLEMLWWTKPYGRRVFGLTPEFAQASKGLAMNQGLYNGFLAAGLIWAIYLGEQGQSIATFFLGCVIFAGVFGAITVNKKILFVQALPAIVALASLYFL